MPPTLLSLTVVTVDRERELRALVRAAWAVSLGMAVVLLRSNLFLNGMRQYAWGRYASYGPAGFIYVLYLASVVIAAVILFLRAYERSVSFRNRRRFLHVLTSIGVACPAVLDFAAGFGIPLRSVGAFAFAAYFLAMLPVVFRYRLVDITPKLASGRVLETMQGAVIVCDLESDVRLMNHAAEEMLGMTKTEVLGRDIRDIVALPCGNDVPSFEVVWTSPEGNRRDVTIFASPLADELDGRPVGTIYVIYDITDRKEGEERLRRAALELSAANRKLEALDRLKSEFVSTVSHELRTPLTSIKAFSEILLMRPDLQQDRRERLLRIMNDESDRLGRLINDLLDLSRIEAGTQQWRKELVLMTEVIRMSADGALPLLQKKGLRLVIAADDLLPPVAGDRDRLVQVVTNLLSNAVKFTPPGGTISISARQEDGPQPCLAVSVSDTGRGIPEEEQSRIFSKFHRSAAEGEVVEGTGLGLTIAREIVEHHGGTISVSSVPGRGSTFSFSLPLEDGVHTAQAAGQ